MVRRKDTQPNKIEEEGNIIKVYPIIDGGKIGKRPFIFDKEDRPYIESLQVYLLKAGKGYPITTRWNKETKKTNVVYLHRAVMGQLGGVYEVDHINADTYDNRKSNLRVCVPEDATNQANRVKQFYNDEYVFNCRKGDTFIMRCGNGYFDNVEIPYLKFSELLKDYYHIYDKGLHKGLCEVLLNHIQVYETMLQQNKGNLEIHIADINALNYLKRKLNEAIDTFMKVKEYTDTHEPEPFQSFQVNGKPFIWLGKGLKDSKNIKDASDVKIRIVDNYKY